MRPVTFLGPWDLAPTLPCLPRTPADGTVVVVASVGKSRALPYHRHKLILVLSALRHRVEELRAAGFDVDLRRAPTYVDGIRAHVAEHGSTEVRAMRPQEWGLDRSLAEGDLGAPLRLFDDGGPGTNFLLPRDDVLEWMRAQRGTLRMDAFYRWVRTRLDVLMEDGRPVGGKWSFDKDNRKPPPRSLRPPPPLRWPHDAITREVVDEVATWPGHWGASDGFDAPVTAAQADEALDDFIAHRLARFGDFQDAMLDGEPWMWHARLSAALNVGLIGPRRCVDAAVAAYARGEAPLAAVEGFVRQVIGWREFMRGVYWLRMPGLRTANLLDADRPLPAAYWDPDATDLRCVSQSVRAVHDHGYAHHIQRLMVLGNFALLLGVEPIQVSHWFWAAFVDAFEWVELPNVHGMAVYADDTFTTKPYAASGAYIHRMSDYCGSCRYDVRQKDGPDACPFNPLFWSFMHRHRERLSSNPRLARLYTTWDRKGAEAQARALATAEAFAASLAPAAHGWSFDDDGG